MIDAKFYKEEYQYLNLNQLILSKDVLYVPKWSNKIKKKIPAKAYAKEAMNFSHVHGDWRVFMKGKEKEYE